MSKDSLAELEDLSRRVLDAEAETRRLASRLYASLVERDALFQKFFGFFLANPVPMVLLDLAGTITDVNLAYCRLCGADESALVGINFQEFTPPEYVASEWEVMERSRQDDRPVQYVVPRIKFDRRKAHYFCTVFLTRDAGGRPSGYGRTVLEATPSQRQAYCLEPRPVTVRAFGGGFAVWNGGSSPGDSNVGGGDG